MTCWYVENRRNIIFKRKVFLSCCFLAKPFIQLCTWSWNELWTTLWPFSMNYEQQEVTIKELWMAKGHNLALWMTLWMTKRVAMTNFQKLDGLLVSCVIKPIPQRFCRDLTMWNKWRNKVAQNTRCCPCTQSSMKYIVIGRHGDLWFNRPAFSQHSLCQQFKKSIKLQVNICCRLVKNNLVHWFFLKMLKW